MLWVHKRSITQTVKEKWMDLADGIMFRVSQIPSQAPTSIWPSRNTFCHTNPVRAFVASLHWEGSYVSSQSCCDKTKLGIFWQSMLILRPSSALKLYSPHLNLCLAGVLITAPACCKRWLALILKAEFAKRGEKKPPTFLQIHAHARLKSARSL